MLVLPTVPLYRYLILESSTIHFLKPRSPQTMFPFFLVPLPILILWQKSNDYAHRIIQLWIRFEWLISFYIHIYLEVCTCRAASPILPIPNTFVFIKEKLLTNISVTWELIHVWILCNQVVHVSTIIWYF